MNAKDMIETNVRLRQQLAEAVPNAWLRQQLSATVKIVQNEAKNSESILALSALIELQRLGLVNETV